MRVAVYARVSTEHEAQINALENQLEWYKIEGSRHPDWEIVEVYVDQGITGTQAQKRPEFLRMMEDAQKGKFDLIITREVSRFARNTVDTLSYTRELKARGVDVFFINDGINTATNDGELRLTIMSSMAQDESRKISERVKAGQKISREKHVLYGSGNILGYRRENGTYVPDPDQAETVRLIFQMYSTGENGLVKIVNELYRLGRLDAGGHVSWDASKVSRVLHNATYKGCICYNKSHSDGYLTQKRVKNLDESSYIYVKGDFEPLVSEEMWDRCQQILASKSTRVIDENGKKHKYMRNTPKSVWTAKLRCSCGAGFIQFKWRVNRDGAVVHGFQCYRRTRRPSISYLQEHGLDLGISCQIKAICEWKLDLMAAKVFAHLTFDKGKTVKEVYKILNRCMAEEKTVRISRKAMLEKSIAKQRERLDKYIDLCADGVITKQELMERRKGLDAQIAELRSQYENVEQEDERSGTLDMNLIAQKLDEWQKASRNDVDRELVNSCVAQITPLTNEEYRWVLDFQLTEVQSRNSATCTLDSFMEMARFRISFEEAKAFKASRNQGIRKNEWHDLTVAVGIRTKT
jgi:DNA invertase Pin-like site-specific DNA recombinase